MSNHIYTCKFCGENKPTQNSLNGHISRCKENPNRKLTGARSIEFRAARTNCKFCKNEYDLINIHSHENSCLHNPINKERFTHICKNCNDEFLHKTSQPFCSKSCATQFNNKNRKPPSDETKQKISEANTGRKYPKRPSPYKMTTIPCPVCQTDIKHRIGANDNRKTCGKQECINELQSRNKLANPSPTCGRRHSNKYKLKNIDGCEYTLDSSYELEFAQKLNENRILWIRPKPVQYLAEDHKIRRYFPDFYVPIWDLYFDPKNDYLIEKDKDKIDRVMVYNDIKVIILSKIDIEKLDVNEFNCFGRPGGNRTPTPEETRT